MKIEIHAMVLYLNAVQHRLLSTSLMQGNAVAYYDVLLFLHKGPEEGGPCAACFQILRWALRFHGEVSHSMVDIEMCQGNFDLSKLIWNFKARVEISKSTLGPQSLRYTDPFSALNIEAP